MTEDYRVLNTTYIDTDFKLQMRRNISIQDTFSNQCIHFISMCSSGIQVVILELPAPCSTRWTTGTLACSWPGVPLRSRIANTSQLYLPKNTRFSFQIWPRGNLWRHARASADTARGLQADAINHLDKEDWRSDSGWFHWRSDLGFTTLQRPERREPQVLSNELKLWRFSGKVWGKRRRGGEKKPTINRKDAQPLGWWGHWEVFIKWMPKALQGLSESQPCSWVD